MFLALPSEPTALQLFLRGFHGLMSAMATLVAFLPLLMAKGSFEHRAAGRLYAVLALLALLVAAFVAVIERNLTLFCFTFFTTYLLLTGWRAIKQGDRPTGFDWSLPAALATLSSFILVRVALTDTGAYGFYLGFFALSGLYLAWRDYLYLQDRVEVARYKIFMPGIMADIKPGEGRIARHVAGMVGSLVANASVVVLSILPQHMQWLWPAALIIIAAEVGRRRGQNPAAQGKRLPFKA